MSSGTLPSMSSVYEYVNPKLSEQWPQQCAVHWVNVRERMFRHLGSKPVAGGSRMVIESNLRHAVSRAMALEASVEELESFLKMILPFTIHEEEELARVRVEVAKLKEVENRRIEVKNKLTQFYRNTCAHIQTSKVRQQLEHKSFATSDPDNNLLIQIHDHVEEMVARKEFEKFRAAGASMREIMRTTKTTLVQTVQERTLNRTLDDTVNVCYKYAASKKEELLQEREELESRLDILIRLPSTASARKPVELKAPFEPGYDRESSKRRALERPSESTCTAANSREEAGLRRDLTRVKASLHAHGHQPTIEASPYRDLFDCREAVGLHPQMQLCQERARIAEASHDKLKKREADAVRELNRVHEELHNCLWEYGPKYFRALTEEDLPREKVVDGARIKAAIGPYDVLQVTRGCSQGDVDHMMKTYFIPAFKDKGIQSVVQTPEMQTMAIVNAAKDDILAALEDPDGDVPPRDYASDHPLSVCVTDVQKRFEQERSKAEDARRRVLTMMLSEMFAPLVKVVEPLGLATTWVAGKQLSKAILDQPVHHLLRHPNLTVVTFDLAEDSALFVQERLESQHPRSESQHPRSVEEPAERTRVRFALPFDPVAVATVRYRLPSGAEFEAPFQVVTVKHPDSRLVFAKLAEAVTAKAERPMEALRERLVDAILQDVCSHTPSKKCSAAAEEGRRRTETLALFGKEVNKRLPPFLTTWSTWKKSFAKTDATVDGGPGDQTLPAVIKVPDVKTITMAK